MITKSTWRKIPSRRWRKRELVVGLEEWVAWLLLL
jgi:hypothetical protein